MTERLLLVSTCGTSLLTNGPSADDRAWLTKVANDAEERQARPQRLDRKYRADLVDEAD